MRSALKARTRTLLCDLGETQRAQNVIAAGLIKGNTDPPRPTAYGVNYGRCRVNKQMYFGTVVERNVAQVESPHMTSNTPQFRSPKWTAHFVKIWGA